MTEPKRLTIDDPIDADTLAKFAELEANRMRLGGQVLDLKSEEVRLMVAARRIDEERQRLFEKILVDRGLHPSTPVEIDAATGQIKQIAVPSPRAEEPTPAG